MNYQKINEYILKRYYETGAPTLILHTDAPRVTIVFNTIFATLPAGEMLIDDTNMKVASAGLYDSLLAGYKTGDAAEATFHGEIIPSDTKHKLTKLYNGATTRYIDSRLLKIFEDKYRNISFWFCDDIDKYPIIYVVDCEEVVGGILPVKRSEV